MKIYTITCHDVYNHGASLQAYGLMKYLTNEGHDVEIIDYKPDYMSNHYKLSLVANPAWGTNIVKKAIYLTLKLPGRMISLKRKKNFDVFTKKYLPLTESRYQSNEELKQYLPEADAYFCGSDQIWNSLHQNGRDKAFYLDFVTQDKIKASYAASFATDDISDTYKPMVREKLNELDGVAIREKSGVQIAKKLGIEHAINVVDPVFLLDKHEWNRLATKQFKEKYILVYDFDKSSVIEKIATEMARKTGYKIYTINADKAKYADKCFNYDGPEIFVSLVRDAQYVIANSFHGVVFSIIYETNFIVVNRTENINTRMRDLLDDLGLEHRLVNKEIKVTDLLQDINFEKCKQILHQKISFSKGYIQGVLGIRKSTKANIVKKIMY